MFDLDEKKEELELDLSEILNDTGAYLQIISMVNEKYGIDLDDYSHIFNYIEEALAEMILTVDEL